MLSCNLTECELPAIGPGAEGLVAAGPYFRGGTGWPGPHSLGAGFGSSHEAAAFAAVRELARLLTHRPGAEGWPLSRLLAQAGSQDGIIDPDTHHTTLPVLIAQVQNGAFRVIQSRDALPGDPYLTRSTAARVSPLRAVT